MGESVHRAVLEEEETGEVESRDRNRERHSLRREPAHREERDQRTPEHHRGLPPRIRDAFVAEFRRLRNGRGENDREHGESRRNREKFLVKFLLKRRKDRGDD